MRQSYFISVLVVVLIIFGFIWYSNKSNTTSPSDTAVVPPRNDTADPITDLIQVTTPAEGASVGSPLTVSGKARGYWYFEASFPIKLIDANGATLFEGPVQAQGDWMTEEFVPFTVTFNFVKPASGTTGMLILHNDNPSGLPENDKSIEIPVTFN